MRQERLDQLKALQDTAIGHAIEEMAASDALTLASKTERGDRAWLTGMCSKSLGVAVRIEQFLILRERSPDFRGAERDEDDETKAQDAFIRRAETQLKSIMDRAKPKFKHGA